MVPTLRDKVTGMFLGIAIGDALGLPAETMTAEAIARRFGRLTTYQPCPSDHRFLPNYPAASISDDTQLTLAVAEAVIAARGDISMDDIARGHIDAYHMSTVGWGSSTIRSVKNLADGQLWSVSAERGPRLGVGNGVVMKIAPLAVLAFVGRHHPNWDEARFRCHLADFTCMTHQTNLAIGSSAAHVGAILYCLANDNKSFSPSSFASNAYRSCVDAPYRSTLAPDTMLAERLRDLRRFAERPATPGSSEIIEVAFGQGRTYVLESLPFSYAHFISTPDSFSSVLNTINAGGDTDSNGSIVGGLLGALHGASIFPADLVEGLRAKPLVLKTVDDFCRVLNITE